jgi:hypothetical protein
LDPEHYQGERLSVDTETIKLILDMGASGSNVEQVKDRLDQLKTSTEAAGKSSVNFGRTALETGRILQDFSQGGVAGILNNIEGFSMAVGGGAGMAGIMTALGLAIYFALPRLKEFSNALFGISDESKPLKERLDNVTKAIESHKNIQLESNESVREYIRLLKEKGELEDQDRQQKEAAAIFDEKPSASKDEKERADTVARLFRGKMPQLYDAIRPAVQREVLSRVKTGEIAPEAQESAIAQVSGQLIAGLRRGDAAAMEQLSKIVPAGSEFSDLLRLSSPEEQRSQREERRTVEERLKQVALENRQEQARRQALAQVQENIKREIERKDKEGEDRAKEGVRRRDIVAQEQRQEEHEAKVKEDAAKHEQEKAKRQAEQTAKHAPHKEALRAVTAASQNAGLGTPDAGQAEAMADDYERGLRDGLSRQQAAISAIMSQMQRMRRTALEFQQQQQALSMQAQMMQQPQSTWTMSSSTFP